MIDDKDLARLAARHLREALPRASITSAPSELQMFGMDLILAQGEDADEIEKTTIAPAMARLARAIIHGGRFNFVRQPGTSETFDGVSVRAHSHFHAGISYRRLDVCVSH